MYQPNPSLTSSHNYILNRNSYGFQDQSANSSSNPIIKSNNIKSYQPYTSSQFQDNNNKMVNSIKVMENRVDGV